MTRRKAQCLMCGVRLVAATTPFCRWEAKKHKVALVPMRLRPHIWAWVREHRDENGISIGNFETL
jgi:hypothetical protein